METLLPTPITELIQQQRSFFATGKTRSLAFRLEQLQRLKQAIVARKPNILTALKADLGKPAFEAQSADLWMLQDLDYALKHLAGWMKPKQVESSVVVFPAKATIVPEPLGVVLIIAPWNYPFYLIMTPLVGAIAAGNCALLKPSELAPRTSSVIASLVQATFDPGYIQVVEGGVETSQMLLAEKFDHIFFTGSTAIGKIVMTAAAQHLTPVTLELGGKSPCIVDRNINLDTTARRITWGKFFNAGQTCVAPDYLLVDRCVKADLLAAIQHCLKEFYGDDPATSPDFARIVSQHHFQRLSHLLRSGQVVVGGDAKPEERYIAPTVLDQVSPDDPVMQSEIFGPILPVLDYEALTDAIAFVNDRPKPLALYLFSQSVSVQEQVLQSTSSGGVCINDTISQVALPTLPFGGVGDSGMGSYHGKASFDTFSHYKSVLTRSFWLDTALRYAPYRDRAKLLDFILGSSKNSDLLKANHQKL